MTYGEAKKFLEKNILPEFDEKNSEIIKEIQDLAKLGLQPQTVTQYDRQVFFGNNSDTGLRLTFDTSVEYKANNTELGKNIATDGKIIDNSMTILEMKALGNFPEKILKFFEKNNIEPTHMSKYAQSIESSHKFTSLKQ